MKDLARSAARSDVVVSGFPDAGQPQAPPYWRFSRLLLIIHKNLSGEATAIQHQYDLDLKPEHVQVLSDADAIAAFFSRLGFNINGRTIQTPGNLGITAESLIRRIRKVELISDDDNLFQVYLFQLPSVTIADARALAAAFRNRAGNFLLVLTANFDRLDFVLMEKYLPSSEDGRGIGLTQVKVRPRTLSVERRKPEPVQLRVLRRFT